MLLIIILLNKQLLKARIQVLDFSTSTILFRVWQGFGRLLYLQLEKHDVFVVLTRKEWRDIFPEQIERIFSGCLSISSVSQDLFTTVQSNTDFSNIFKGISK